MPACEVQHLLCHHIIGLAYAPCNVCPAVYRCTLCLCRQLTPAAPVLRPFKQRQPLLPETAATAMTAPGPSAAAQQPDRSPAKPASSQHKLQAEYEKVTADSSGWESKTLIRWRQPSHCCWRADPVASAYTRVCCCALCAASAFRHAQLPGHLSPVGAPAAGWGGMLRLGCSH